MADQSQFYRPIWILGEILSSPAVYDNIQYTHVI